MSAPVKQLQASENPNLALALEFARAGIPVTRVRPDDKRPCAGTHGTRDATTDEETIRSWPEWDVENAMPAACAGQWSDGRYGLVLDVDPPEKQKRDPDTNRLRAEQIIDDFEEHIGVKLPDTYVRQSKSGGLHLFFTHSEPVPKLPLGKLFPGIEVQGLHATGSGAYVVLYPNARTAGALENIAAAPRELIEAVGKVKAPTATAPEPAPARELSKDDVEDAIKNATDWLSRQPVPEPGQRDATLHKTGAMLKDYGVPRERAREVMAPWLEKMDRSPTDGSGPFTDEQVEKCLAQGYRTQGQPGSKGVLPADFDDLTTGGPAVNAETFDVEEPAGGFTAADLTLEEFTHRDYLLKSWLDRGTQALFHGVWGGGKTFAVLHISAHIAAGKPWFGFRVRPTGVLVLAYEGAKNLRKRVFALKREFPDWDWDSIPLKVVPLRTRLVTRNGGGDALKAQQTAHRALEEFRREYGAYPGLVVVDPLRNALGGSDSDAELVEEYLGWCRALTDKTGATSLTVTHPGHSSQERARGDSGIPAAMDAVLRLKERTQREGNKWVGTGRWVLSSTKQRDDDKRGIPVRLAEVELTRDQDGDPVTTCVLQKDDGCRLDLTARQREVWDLIQGVAEGGKANRRALLDGFESAHPDKARRQCRDALRNVLTELAQKNLIEAGTGEITILYFNEDEIFDDISEP